MPGSLPGDPQREDAPLARATHDNRLSDSDPWNMVMQARAQRGRILSGGCADALARLRLCRPGGAARRGAALRAGWPMLPGTSQPNGAGPRADVPEQAPAA